jgi:hypothetical protein
MKIYPTKSKELNDALGGGLRTGELTVVYDPIDIGGPNRFMLDLAIETASDRIVTDWYDDNRGYDFIPNWIERHQFAEFVMSNSNRIPYRPGRVHIVDHGIIDRVLRYAKAFLTDKPDVAIVCKCNRFNSRELMAISDNLISLRSPCDRMVSVVVTKSRNGKPSIMDIQYPLYDYKMDVPTCRPDGHEGEVFNPYTGRWSFF